MYLSTISWQKPLVIIFGYMTGTILGNGQSLQSRRQCLDNLPTVNWQVLLFRLATTRRRYHSCAVVDVAVGLSVVRMLVIAGGWTRSGYKAEMPTKSVIVIKLDPLGNPLTNQGFQAEDLPSATLSCEKKVLIFNAIDILACLFQLLRLLLTMDKLCCLWEASTTWIFTDWNVPWLNAMSNYWKIRN